MDISQAIVLGTIQGLTEFLPVSSSGHLVLAQRLFGLSEGVLRFDIAVHLATLVSVAVVFWKDLVEIFKKPWGRLPLMIIVATIPAVIIGFAFKDLIEHLFESGKSLGFEFIVTGFVLLLCEKVKNVGKDEKSLSVTDALVIGTAQAVAILPAVSRSGLTIAGALWRGLDRKFAAKFSFLLSMPAIFGSAVFDLKDVLEGGAVQATGGMGLPVLLTGMLFAGVFGFISIRWMIRILIKGSLKPFAYYVLGLGVLVILEQLFWGRYLGQLL
jgi:undecaprenyl-diphosphatase